ncbi:MAG: methylated-DNA--[protein]-cysteine S-methyltransferase, partial [Acidimicrobiia bacterium]
MTDVTELLSQLATEPPADLEMNTALAAGAADKAAVTESPFGDLWISWSKDGVTAVSPRFETNSFEEFASNHRRIAYETAKLPSDLGSPINDALTKGKTDGVPIDWRGIAEFQRAVLAACATIPNGSVRSYGWIAETIDNPGSVRAVGTALGRNPIPLLVPCHRVV